MKILIGWLKRKWEVIAIVLLLIGVQPGYSKWDYQLQPKQMDGKYVQVKAGVVFCQYVGHLLREFSMKHSVHHNHLS